MKVSSATREMFDVLLQSYENEGYAEEVLKSFERLIEEKIIDVLRRGINQYKNDDYFCFECYDVVELDGENCPKCGGQRNWDLIPWIEMTKEDVLYFLKSAKKKLEEHKKQSISTFPYDSGVSISDYKLVEILNKRVQLQEKIVRHESDYQKIEKKLKQLHQEELDYLKSLSDPLEGGDEISDEDLPF